MAVQIFDKGFIKKNMYDKNMKYNEKTQQILFALYTHISQFLYALRHYGFLGDRWIGKSWWKGYLLLESLAEEENSHIKEDGELEPEW